MIAASRDQTPAVGAERHAADEACVTAEGADHLSRVAVPDFHSAIFPGRRDPSSIAVRAERQGVDLTLVSPEDLEFLAGLYVPDLDRVLLTARRQPPLVRAEGQIQTRPGDSRPNGAASLLLLV